MWLNPQNEPMKAHKQMPTVLDSGRFFVAGSNFWVRCRMANRAAYWLVKTASKITVMVVGFGAAASSGMVAFCVPVTWMVVKMKPTKIVTKQAVIMPDKINLRR